MNELRREELFRLNEKIGTLEAEFFHALDQKKD